MPTALSEKDLAPRHRILIGEENPLFRRGLRALLEADASLEVLGEAGTAEDLRAKLLELPVDLIILSEHLLRSQAMAGSLSNRSTICLVENADAAISAPLATSVLRSCAATQLVSCVRSLPGVEPVAPPSRAVLTSRAPDALTEREREVISLLATGITVRDAAAELSLSWKTVEAHTFNLMRKLDIHDRASLLAYARLHGLSRPQSTLQAAD